jgi:YegS/Rv2252/BmrU family lipid kinase
MMRASPSGAWARNGKVIVVFNPTAGRRRRQRLWRVLDLLVQHGQRVEVAETAYAGHATALAREAAAGGARLVVAAGGDGTVAEVANGLAGSGARLGILPLGTANVLARELGLRPDPHSLAAALAFGRGRVHWPGLASGADGERLFVRMLGAGFDAQVVHHLPPPLKRLLGRGAYVVQTLRESLRRAHGPLTVRLDGATGTEAAAVIVTKGRLYAGPWLLAPDAAPGLPGFAVALFEGGGPLAPLRYGAALPLNRLPRQPGLRLVRAREVEILGSGVPTQADGDPAGTVPVRVTDAREPIEILVP